MKFKSPNKREAGKFDRSLERIKLRGHGGSIARREVRTTSTGRFVVFQGSGGHTHRRTSTRVSVFFVLFFSAGSYAGPASSCSEIRTRRSTGEDTPVAAGHEERVSRWPTLSGLIGERRNHGPPRLVRATRLEDGRPTTQTSGREKRIWDKRGARRGPARPRTPSRRWIACSYDARIG